MTSAIEFYGAQWSGDCRRAKQVLDRYHVDYNHHDIESEEGAAEKAEQSSGLMHIPVLLFVVGTVFVEPTYQQLTGKLKELGIIE